MSGHELDDDELDVEMSLVDLRSVTALVGVVVSEAVLLLGRLRSD